jgi:DnaJ-class molecular chaperone
MVYKTCTICDGTGRRTCPQCNGVGQKMYRVNPHWTDENGIRHQGEAKHEYFGGGRGGVTAYAGYSGGKTPYYYTDYDEEWKTCPYCEGEKNFECGDCRGSGKVWETTWEESAKEWEERKKKLGID